MFILRSKLSLLGIAMAVLSLFSACTAKEQLPPPNIVWITSEDNSVHYLKLYDENGVSTPNIEALAAQGLTFDHAFSNAAVCSAARSTLISQCYGPRVGSHYHRRLEKVPMPEGVEMYPAYLKAAGYYTTNNNKEDYNINTGEQVWDASDKKATWRNRAEGQPFFHIQNFVTTHESRLHFTQEEFEKGETVASQENMFIFPNHPQTDLFRYSNARYHDKHVQMDKQVGEVVAKLKEDGLMDNTFIFYYGDHGGVLPGSKGYIYESGVHVPLVVYIPENYKHLVDFERGERVDGFVDFTDIPTTTLKLAGVEIPQGIDGKAFLGEGVTAKDVNKRDEVYSYADRFDEKYDMVRAMRKGNFKYIRSYQPFNYDGMFNEYRYKQLGYQQWKQMYIDGELNAVQSAFFETRAPEMLFDLDADPYETKDLSNDPAYAKKLQEMRTLLQKQESSMPDLSFYPEYYLIKNAFENPVAFGQANKETINRYMAIADLQLIPFAEAKSSLEEALASEDAFDRYWALCACSSFATEAKSLADKAQEIALNDSELINRVRAAEFLAIALDKSPVEVMSNAFYSSLDEAEALLIMNSIVLMADINYDYQFSLDRAKFQVDISDPRSEVLTRVKYVESLN